MIKKKIKKQDIANEVIQYLANFHTLDLNNQKEVNLVLRNFKSKILDEQNYHYNMYIDTDNELIINIKETEANIK